MEESEVNSTQVIESPHDVDTRLAEIGLTRSIIEEALRQANLYRVRLTAHHPRLYRYQVMSAETVAALRDLLVPQGWHKSDDGNYELTVRAELNVAIAVASGDDGTGNPRLTPSNKSPKGRHTVDAVATNRQIDMFADLIPVESIDDNSIGTWILLHHIKAGKIDVELSRPNEIGDDGKINSWSERILLGAIDLDDDNIIVTPPQQPDLNIEISRKSA